ncbi:unnamed protein product [Polarella glacialis]|uniref:Uncharacterized protein n=1 Tax=Polarella glacialis TaxID=89957 RepID=A0A813HY23_POLGL|nr:unnamed protein product [Polarella glacialis]
MERLAGILEDPCLAETFPNPAAGNLRCCGRAWRSLGREGGGHGLVVSRVLALQSPAALRTLLGGDLLRWEKLVTLDVANVLDTSTGLRNGACRAVAGAEATKLRRHEPSVALLPEFFPRLQALKRLSLSVEGGSDDKDDKAQRLVAPNCIQELGKLTGLQELYLAVGHFSLEVAMLGALSGLRELRKLWLHLCSLEYSEAVTATLVSRLPQEHLEVLGLWGTARQLRDVLAALGPKGEKTLPRLRELDLSTDRDGPGGRIADPKRAAGEIPADMVWAVLERGAPNLVLLCLSGALGWYPPVADVWFAQLLQLVDRGGASSLRCIDLTKNRIRADVADRVLQHLQQGLGEEFRLLWDGDQPAAGCNEPTEKRPVVKRKRG